MCHVLFIHSPVSGYLGYFYLLAIVNMLIFFKHKHISHSSHPPQSLPKTTLDASFYLLFQSNWKHKCCTCKQQHPLHTVLNLLFPLDIITWRLSVLVHTDLPLRFSKVYFKFELEPSFWVTLTTFNKCVEFLCEAARPYVEWEGYRIQERPKRLSPPRKGSPLSLKDRIH